MTDIETFARAEGAKVFGCAEGEVERLRAEIVAVHGEIDDLYERLYEAAHCGSARECQLMVLAILDKDGEAE